MPLNDCRQMQLREITDSRGSLVSIEAGSSIDFEIKRIYYLYGVAPEQSRGEHAHRDLKQVFIAISGSFDITLDDGVRKEKFTLDRPNQGLYVPKMIWRKLENFSPSSCCLVLASEHYDEADYYRNYEDFLNDITPTQP